MDGNLAYEEQTSVTDEQSRGFARQCTPCSRLRGSRLRAWALQDPARLTEARRSASHPDAPEGAILDESVFKITLLYSTWEATCHTKKK